MTTNYAVANHRPLREQVSLALSIWSIARRYPVATVWVGGIAAVAYLLIRRTKDTSRGRLLE